MHYNFIKQTNKRYLEELNNRWHEFPNVWKAVNIMQKTEWTINKPVLEVLKVIFKNSYGMGNVPVNPEDIPLPITPHDIDTNPDAKIKWKRETSKIYRQRAKSKSKYIQVARIIEQADYFLEKGEQTAIHGLWYCYQLDFRGRAYPKSVLLSPQSADYSKSLIKFQFGKPIGDGFEDFAIAGAGLYGEVDKEELSIRLQWVKDNADNFINCANNPLEENYWSKADKPFQFLAWCMEYRDYAKSDFSPDFITTLPIHTDCSNSGLQHYSAMMRDEIGGKATNLVPSNRPSDVYAIVAEKLKMKLREIRNSGVVPIKQNSKRKPLTKEENKTYANLWLEYGIDRKLCKKPVMCLPYSLTQYKCREYLSDHVEKEYIEKGKQHSFGDDLFLPTHWLTPILWESINDIILGAREIMDFLKKVSKLVAKENLPISWTSPLGLPIVMFTYKKESKRVKTKMGDSIVKLSVTSDTKKIDTKKVSQSCCPNFIHSIDASVLLLAVVKASEDYKVDNFSLIHDSFGVLAPDVKHMAKSLREAFVEIYSKDVLANWANEMKQMLSDKNKKDFPSIPAKGKLNIEDVKRSVFFCV